MTLDLFRTRLPERSLARHGPSPIVIREPSSAPSGALSPWRRWVAALIVVILAIAVCEQPASAGGRVHRYTVPPKILVLRGVFEVFSLGMNDLTKKLACRGYDVKVTSWSLALHEVECSDQQPYVIIGHSLGGRMCGWVPRKLMKCGKRVPLVIIVDANLMKPIPPNVERCLNLYVTNPFGIFHGSPVRGESPCTEIINWDVSQGQPSCFQGGVNHFDIDATPWVHQIIIDEIEETFPSPLEMAMAGKDRSINNCRSYARQSVDRQRKPRSGDRSYQDRCDSYFSADAKPARGTETTLDAPFEVALPAPDALLSLSRTRGIPWSSSREEIFGPHRAQRSPLLFWKPERAQRSPLLSWKPERPESTSQSTAR